MSREAIISNEIASPIGPICQAVRGGDFVFLSGQVAQSPATGKLALNAVYERHFQAPHPARTTIAVSALGASVEIDLVSR